MKKVFAIVCAIALLLVLVACEEKEDSDVEKAKQYSIGDEITIAEKNFFVYKIDNGKVCLIAAENESIIPYRSIDSCVNRYAQELQKAGIKTEFVGLMDYEDLDDLGGNRHTLAISGLPYLCYEAPAFIKSEDSYWLAGYSKYDTYTWLYKDEEIDMVQFKDCEYGFRPVVHILATEMQ